MIRHHAPREQPVPLSVEVRDRIRDHRSNALIPHKAGAIVVIESLAELRLNPFLGFGRCAAFGSDELELCFGFFADLFSDVPGYRVEEVECDEVDSVRYIPVWEAFSFVDVYMTEVELQTGRGYLGGTPALL